MSDLPDADGCVAVINAALRWLAVLDPHRADLIHQTLLLGIALAGHDNPRTPEGTTA